MHETLLNLLRCPYCGTALSIVENEALRRRDSEIDDGVLGCECCAFPVVDGIPVLIADDATRSAMHTLEARRPTEALTMLLGLDDGRAERFKALRSAPAPGTYLEALAVLSQDAEADYLAYRLSDPTYLTSEAVIRALRQEPPPAHHRVLDVCGGAGHLTRVLQPRSEQASRADSAAVLLDRSFWKLWLAKHYTSPDCTPVCADANHPLPFVRDSFHSVLLSDAFPYIWHKRLLADELMRLAGPDGTVIMPHLHSALGDNVSAGDTLTPAAYRDLLAPQGARLFSDAGLLENLLEDRSVDLSRAASPDDLADESSLTLIASRHEDIFRRYDLPADQEVIGELRVNPLYRVEWREGASILTLTFPTPEYAEEFAACRRYLPETVKVRADLGGAITRSTAGSDYEELRRRRVLLDVPPHYC